MLIVHSEEPMKDLTSTGHPHGLSGATSDGQLIGLWLEGRSPHTQRAYTREAQRFLAFVQKPLSTVTLADLYDFEHGLEGSPSTRTRAMAAVKSLLSFGQRVGYLPFNVGAAVRLRSGQNRLTERIVGEPDVHRLLALETNPRNHALLRFLYVSGLRVSEVVALTWANMVTADEGGYVNVHGKGDKTRVVRIPTGPWAEVAALRPDEAGPDTPVFLSRLGGALDVSAVRRMVSRAAKRAGLEGNVSPHWLRHAHASHALDRGAPISLVQSTLGHSSIATTGRYLHARPGESSGNYLSA